jgi:HEAT repeat protein
MRSIKLLSFAPIARFASGCLVAGAALLAADATAAPRQVTPSGSGFAGVYGNVPADQAEFLSSSDAIKSAAVSGAPTLIWETLEHGESIECLDCISVVSPLLYDANAKNREIAAWWLRRRIFGVFGPGEVYQQTLQTLQSDTSPTRRAYAANALGEFFVAAGVAVLSTALTGDTDANVRAAAATALGRLNNDGNGVLAMGLSDSDSSVKLAVLAAAAKINVFSGVSSVAALTTDANSDVRRATVEALEALHAADSVAAVAAVAQKDSDPRVRGAACHALGAFGDASARPVLTNISLHDTNGLVRDLAGFALLQI